MRRWMTVVLAAAAVLCGSHTTYADGNRVAVEANVTGDMNIYGAGHAVPPGPGGGGGGILPLEISIPAGTNRTVTFSMSGTTDNGTCCAANGPDGVAFASVLYLPQYNGLSGCDFPTRGRYLLGVFLDDTVPADPPPDSLYFPDGSFTELFPGLRQIFFLGDGLTGEGTGSTQVFHIPDGATRLFLGRSDRCSTSPNVPGWFDDNSGTITGTVTFEVTTAIGKRAPVPMQLHPNFPNPFGAETTISFTMETPDVVELNVYDVRGRHVRTLLNERRGPGTHSASWDGRDMDGRAVPAGIYYCRLASSALAQTRKMVVLR